MIRKFMKQVALAVPSLRQLYEQRNALLRERDGRLLGDALTLSSALSRIAANSISINTVIDVGASDGRWSRVAREYFASARYLLVEANPIHKPALEQWTREVENVEYVMAAAGNYVGEIFFDVSDPFGGLASTTPLDTRKCERVPVTTVDAEVCRRRMAPPFLVKLDTHGFEMPILDGCRLTLSEANLIVMETYNFKLTDACLRFHEMCAYLEEKGFRVIDLSDPLHRPTDNAFWQIDLYFIPSRSRQFASNTYK